MGSWTLRPDSASQRYSASWTGAGSGATEAAAWLETMIQAGTESLILSPGHFVVQTACSLWRTRATIHYAQDSSERTYSPMILTNTRFRRRPSNSP